MSSVGTLSELLVTPDVLLADLVIDSLAVTVWADCPGGAIGQVRAGMPA